MFGRGKDRVDGTARLVSYTETRDRDEFEAIVQAKLVVQAEGLPATEVESYVAVRSRSFQPTPAPCGRSASIAENPELEAAR